MNRGRSWQRIMLRYQGHHGKGSGGVVVLMMSPDDLRRVADDLEERLKNGQPGRHQARAMTVGHLVVSGKLPISTRDLARVRRASAQEPDGAQLLSQDLLDLHGYKVDDGQLIGPSSWPGGAPGEAPAQHDEGASPGAVGESGGGTISRDEARRQIGVAQDYADWAAEVRRFDVWTQAQERRALLFGRAFAGPLIARPNMREWIRSVVAKGGDEAEIELWSDADLRADYNPADLGEGS